MAPINKNALISITRGNATGFSRIRFNIPEEMRYTFPISELFKMDVIGFDVLNVDFREEQGKFLILLHTKVSRSKIMNALFTFAVHPETFMSLKNTLIQEDSLTTNAEFALSQIKKVVDTYPPIIQIIPKTN